MCQPNKSPSSRVFGAVTGADNALDKVGLVRAGGIDGRGGRLGSLAAAAPGSGVDATEEGTEDAHGQLRFDVLVSAC